MKLPPLIVKLPFQIVKAMPLVVKLPLQVVKATPLVVKLPFRAMMRWHPGRTEMDAMAPWHPGRAETDAMGRLWNFVNFAAVSIKEIYYEDGFCNW